MENENIDFDDDSKGRLEASVIYHPVVIFIVFNMMFLNVFNAQPQDALK